MPNEIDTHVTGALRRIFAEGLHATDHRLPPGLARGVELLGETLQQNLANSVTVYAEKHNRLPDLIAPETFTEKLLLFKFFAPIPVTPSPSDKLRSIAYVPPDCPVLFMTPKR